MIGMTSTALRMSSEADVTESIRIRVPATGGELWQGFVGGQLIMVNSPISYFGEVAVTKTSVCGAIEAPDDSCLVRETAALVRRELGDSSGLRIQLVNPVPRGLGMASSTTEIAATAYGVARLLGCDPRQAVEISHRVVCRFDTGNDHNYVTGLHLVDPKQGLILSSFPQVPQMRVLLVHTGGRLDTSAMDRKLEQSIGRKRQAELEKSLAKMLCGLALHDLKLIGAAATENARIYQEITPKPYLDEVLKLVECHPECLGVLSGHSGTVIGLLLSREELPSRLESELAQIYGRQGLLGEFKLTSGGIHEHFSLS